jgi:hypothetical protein
MNDEKGKDWRWRVRSLPGPTRTKKQRKVIRAGSIVSVNARKRQHFLSFLFLLSLAHREKER